MTATQANVTAADSSARTPNFDLPPGPSAPGVLQILHWIFAPFDLMERYARRYGDAFTVRAPGSPPIIYLSDPEAVKEVFAGDPKQLLAGRANRFLKPLVGERSLLLLDGAPHLRERRLMMPAFHGERMQLYGELMHEITRRRIAGWPLGRPFPLLAETQGITLDVILQAVLGYRAGADYDRLRARLATLLVETSRPASLLAGNNRGEIWFERAQLALGKWSPWGRVRGLLDGIDELLYAEIARRRAASALSPHDDVLAMLIAARDESGGALDDRALRDELLTLILAGHETTATSLGFVVHRLLQHPEVMARARDEVTQIGGDGSVAPKRIAELHYLDAVIRETMRLQPILPLVARFTAEPLRIGGRSYPAGVLLAPCIYLVHRRADLFPDPLRFDPGRFLGQPVPPHVWFPFGGGVRRCIGMAFAMYEMKVVLAELLRHTTLRLAPGYTMKVVRRGPAFGPSQGLPVLLQQRES